MDKLLTEIDSLECEILAICDEVELYDDYYSHASARLRAKLYIKRYDLRALKTRLENELPLSACSHCA